MYLKDFHTVYLVLSPPPIFPRFLSPPYPQIYILFVFIQRKNQNKQSNKIAKIPYEQKYIQTHT